MVIRRQSRGRGGGAARTHDLVLVGLVAFFLVGALVPTGAFSMADVPRAGTFGVAGDANAELGLTVFACIDKNTIDPLVTVENDLQETVDVTVALVDPSLGTLHVGTRNGDSVTFNLAVSGTDTVYFESTTGGPWPKPIEFTVDAVGTDTAVAAARSSQLANRCT